MTFQVRRLESQAAERSMPYSAQMPPASSILKVASGPRGGGRVGAAQRLARPLKTSGRRRRFAGANAVSIELAIVRPVAGDRTSDGRGRVARTSVAGAVGRSGRGTLSRRDGPGTVRSGVQSVLGLAASRQRDGDARTRGTDMAHRFGRGCRSSPRSSLMFLTRALGVALARIGDGAPNGPPCPWHCSGGAPRDLWCAAVVCAAVGGGVVRGPGDSRVTCDRCALCSRCSALEPSRPAWAHSQPGQQPRAPRRRGRVAGLRRIVRCGDIRDAGDRRRTRREPCRSSVAVVTETDREVVTAYVESPTFGGSSWLAHLSLISGVEVRDQFAYTSLMASSRETMISNFARRGYRTVALMPGMRQAWPEGAFYRYDQIYGRDLLEYRGPEFGWWSIPDQYALAKIDALERNRLTRKPLFLVFPTSTTHAPFGPVAPYQPDWSRMLASDAFGKADVERAMASTPDLTNLRPSYTHAMAYEYATIAGYLRQHPRDGMILIAIGDHQPPAAVSGRGASWSVPVHVFGRRGADSRSPHRARLPCRARAAPPADRSDAHADGDVSRRVQRRARFATQAGLACRPAASADPDSAVV